MLYDKTSYLFFKKIVSKLENFEPPVAVLEERQEVEQSPPQSKKLSKNKSLKKKTEITLSYERSLRDFTEMMENPFWLSQKNVEIQFVMRALMVVLRSRYLVIRDIILQASMIGISSYSLPLRCRKFLMMDQIFLLEL